jgi:Flp pilus assembly protein TadB
MGSGTGLNDGANRSWWSRLARKQRVLAVIVLVWLLGLVATVILIAIHVIPFTSAVWVFLAVIPIFAYSSWVVRSLRYNRASRSHSDE